MSAMLLDGAAMPTALGDAFSWVLSSFGQVMTTIANNPILCLGICFWVAGAAIGLYQRLV